MAAASISLSGQLSHNWMLSVCGLCCDVSHAAFPGEEVL